MGIITENIRSKLNDQFSPQLLEIEDQSESHRGHVGHREGGETHFHVRLTSLQNLRVKIEYNARD